MGAFLSPREAGESLKRRRFPGGRSRSSPGTAGRQGPERMSPNNVRSPRPGTAADLRSRAGEIRVRATLPPNRGRRQGIGEQEGDRKRCRGLTCVAASSVSWSGLKPIWTFFGRWRKHLQNLKSGRRHVRQNGGRAPQHPGASGSRNPRGPHPRRPPGAAGPAPSPRRALREVYPIPKPRLFLPTPAPQSGGREHIPFCFVLRSKGPDTPGQGQQGSATASAGRRAPRRCPGLGALPCASSRGAGVQKVAPRSGAWARRAGLREGLGAPGHNPLSSARTMRPPLGLERLRRTTFRCPSK